MSLFWFTVDTLYITLGGKLRLFMAALFTVFAYVNYLDMVK